MQIFSKLYVQVLSWSDKKYAPLYLALLSFFESFILPYPPPDILLAPMALKKPNKSYQFALICLFFSVLGGIVGYLIGALALDIIYPYLDKWHYLNKLTIVQSWFDEYGILIILIAGFSPMPYKIFTLSAGITSMAFIPFVFMSILARGMRFFLVAFLIKKFGSACDIWLEKNINRLGYGLIIVIILWIIYAKNF
jgi:membrane protein YqaA with SNARE-associated domain